MKVALLVLDGVFDTGLATLADTLAIANELVAERPLFDVSLVGVRRRAKTGQGLTAALAPLPRRRPDLVLVPALGAKDPTSIAAALERPDVLEAAEVLADWEQRGACIAAACTGTFVVALSHVLEGRRATTSWWLEGAFRERFPLVQLDPSKMLVDAGSVVTAGAALAHVDLALWAVRRESPSLAAAASRLLTFDGRSSQAAYSLAAHVPYSDELVERFERWTKANFCAFSIERAARAVGASPRTLERHVHRVLGKSPLAFVQELRVREAVHRLETTDQGLDDIALQVGYQSGVTLRTLLRRRTGLGVRALRNRSRASLTV